MDLEKVIELAGAIIEGAVKLAPVIQKDLSASAPFVAAIVELVRSGGQPTDEQFEKVNELLDLGSEELADRASEAQAWLDGQAGGGTA